MSKCVTSGAHGPWIPTRSGRGMLPSLPRRVSLPPIVYSVASADHPPCCCANAATANAAARGTAAQTSKDTGSARLPGQPSAPTRPTRKLLRSLPRRGKSCMPKICANMACLLACQADMPSDKINEENAAKLAIMRQPSHLCRVDEFHPATGLRPKTKSKLVPYQL